MKKLLITFSILAIVIGVAVAALATHRTEPEARTIAPASVLGETMVSHAPARPALVPVPAGITAKDQGSNLVPPDDKESLWSIRQADGKRLVSTTLNDEPDVARIPGAVTERTLMTERLHDAATIQGGVSKSRDERDVCIADFVKRGGKITENSNWAIGLRFKSDGKEIRVTEVVVPETYWPAAFDQEIKDCYVKSYGSIRFPSTDRIDYLAEYPVCVSPQ